MANCRLEQFLPNNSSGPNKCRSPIVHRKHANTGTLNNDLEMHNQLIDTGPMHDTEVLLNEMPSDLRQKIVEYLGQGDAEVLHITDENFHDYLHIAFTLNHHSLLKVCLNFIHNGKNQDGILNNVNNCQCYQFLVNFRCEPVCACHKSDTRPVFAKYAILFPKKSEAESKNVAHVINLTDGSVVTKKTPNRVQNMGNGFALNTVYKKECPYVVVSGGEGKHATSLKKYDVILNKWVAHSKLKCARVNHLMVPVSGCIYILGGNNCDTIETFNPVDNKTVQLDTKLLVEVRSAIATVWKDKVFIFGGKSQRGHVSCVQCFDTATNRISRLTDLPCQCSGGQAVLVDDKVFIATHQGHMIAFDPATGSSFLCAHQPIKRKHFFMFEKNGEVFLTDGARTDGCTTSELPICKYYPDRDIWQKLPTTRPQMALQASCIIELKKRCPVVPFMNLYTY